MNEGAKDILGETVSMAIFQYLEMNYSLKMEEVPRKLAIFSAGMRNILSESFSLVEMSITKKLYSKLELEFNTIEGYVFVDYVEHAKQKQNQP